MTRRPNYRNLCRLLSIWFEVLGFFERWTLIHSRSLLLPKTFWLEYHWFHSSLTHLSMSQWLKIWGLCWGKFFLCNWILFHRLLICLRIYHSDLFRHNLCSFDHLKNILLALMLILQGSQGELLRVLFTFWLRQIWRIPNRKRIVMIFMFFFEYLSNHL